MNSSLVILKHTEHKYWKQYEEWNFGKRVHPSQVEPSVYFSYSGLVMCLTRVFRVVAPSYTADLIIIISSV